MDGLLLGLRVLLSLACVLGLMMLVHRRVSRAGGKRRSADLAVLARQGVGGKAQIVLLEAAGQRFLLGVTEHQVNVLHTSEAPAVEFETALAEAAGKDEPVDLLPSALPRHEGAGPLAGSLLEVGTWRAALRAVSGRNA